MIIQFPNQTGYKNMSELFPKLTNAQSSELSEFHQTWSPADLGGIHMNKEKYIVTLERWTALGYGPKEVGLLSRNISECSVDGSKYSMIKDEPTVLIHINKFYNQRHINRVYYAHIGSRDRVKIIGKENTWFEENKDYIQFFHNIPYRQEKATLNMYRAVEYWKSLGKPVNELNEMDANNAFANDVSWNNAYNKLFDLFAEIAQYGNNEYYDIQVGFMISCFFIENGMNCMPHRVDEAIDEIKKIVAKWSVTKTD